MEGFRSAPKSAVVDMGKLAAALGHVSEARRLIAEDDFDIYGPESVDAQLEQAERILADG